MSDESALVCIDPGTTESGWCVMRGRQVIRSGITRNLELLERVKATGEGNRLAIEMIASYGMPVGAETFETCVWIGRFQQAWHSPDEVRLVLRRDVKLHLCGSSRAKDPNIRQALLDLLGPQGTRKDPGPLYGVKSHAWAAVAVGATVLQLSPLFDGVEVAPQRFKVPEVAAGMDLF